MRSLSFITFLFCLALNIQAQDLIVTNDGVSIKVYNLEISGQSVFYTLGKAENSTLYKMAKSDILIIRKQDGTKLQFDGDAQQPVTSTISTPSGKTNMPVVDIANYKGFLLQKGNAVYIASGQTSYELAGAARLRELLSQNGFWKVADTEEQAHFIIKYVVHLEGQDHLEFYFLDRRNRLSAKEIRNFKYSSFGNGQKQIFTSEDKDDNIMAAGEMYERIVKIQEKISEETNFTRGWYGLFYQE